jgi:hypothetical protein
MSNNLSSVAGPNLGTSLVDKPERMLDGFPWVSAIVLYTLSWGWSLLRPNTLYWDDWSEIFNQKSSYTHSVAKAQGLPPWSKTLDWFFLEVGMWTMPIATFVAFFIAGLWCFGILKSMTFIRGNQLNIVLLIYLVVPVNHARISRICFDYTSSYFLFFLGWFVMVRYKSIKSFVVACVILFLSLKTHSFLFFALLPFLHFAWLNKTELLDFKKLNHRHLQIVVIAALPVLYVILRSIFWPLNESWQDYQKPTSAGLMTGLWPILIGLFAGLIVVTRILRKKFVHQGFILFVIGFLITALVLFPYFLAELYVGYAGRPAYVTVFEFRADWRSRHQLLMPLGLALSVVGLNELFKGKRNKNIFAGFIIVVSVALNMFWGSQYFLQSLKQEKIVELLKATKNETVIASLGDQTLRFNGRENSFRGYEWDGFMTLAGISTDRPGCEALPDGSVVVLKSDKPYLSALISRDLGLYFDVTPCSEVLAKDS